MSDQKRNWIPWLIVVVLLAVLLWATERHARTVAEERARAQTDSAQTARAAVDSLKGVEAALRTRYATDTVTLTRWRTRWDSIVGPGRTDTLTVERVVVVADSTIRACEVVVTTCERRVAVATERGDSAERESAHWQEAAGQWKRQVKGPWIRPSIEATIAPGLVWQAAGEVTLGRGALKLLGRVDVGEGAETCSLAPNTETYTCATPVAATLRAGVRWSF